MKWTGAVVLAASLVEVSAMNARTDLMKHAVKATQGVPALREKERKRRLAFKTKMENLIQSKPQRKLQNNNGYYGNYNYGQNQGNYNGNQGGQGNYNGNQAQNNYNGQGQDYNGYWYGNDYNYEWNQEMAEEEFGFDISAYSIKYTGCHTVETYNEMLAENDQFETVLGTQRYATFRLCPVEYCNTNNKWGCDQNYGEYVVPLGNYVESIVEYGQERVQAYCEFCEDCAAREAYRSWARSQINQMEYDMQLAEQLYEQFKQNMQRQNAYDNAEAQGGGYYMQDADYYENDDQSDATYMMAYYKRVSNMQGNNNGNNGNGNNNGGNYNQYNQNQNPQSNYNFYNQNMWKFSNNQQYQQNEQEQNQNQVNQDYWSNMGQFATFNGHSIYPGYFTNQGEFVAGWGYFYQGNWVSMEDQEVVWDENLYGEAPDAWQNYIGEDPDGIEVCEYEYSSGCYQNYDQCMMYLAADAEDDDWYPDWYNVDYDYNANNNGNNNNNKANQNYQNYVEQQQQKQENQFLAMTGQMFACHQVIYNPEWDGDYNENYQNQQYTNAQMYQLNKYMEYKLEECGQDENCIYDVETQMQQNQEFMEWLQEYNEKLYDQWINGEKLFYIGASCDDDGGIKLSVYNDEDCSYEDSTVTAEKVLGFDITDYMNYDLIPDQCIPCDNQNYMQDQYYFGEDGGDGEEEGITPMCSMLYQISGKCNENLKPENLFTGYYQDGEYVEVNYDQMYQSYSQQQNQDLVCSFIESLNSGTYDQSGQVYLDNTKWGAPAKWQQGVAEASRNMPGGLKAALFLTFLAAALMSVWACMLHGSLARKNIPWQPKRAAAGGGDPVDMARQNSGIVMGRSRSGPVTHPLI